MLLPTSQTFAAGDLDLELGGMLPDVTVAYETYGALAPDGNNAILLSHGYTNHQHAGDGGWFDGVIGPGKPMDTNRFCVICSNMIGSSYGSTAPGTLNPDTGKPYGPDFPRITTGDMVAVQHRLIDHLGVGQLAAKVGNSYGGHLTYEWATRYPDKMRAVVPVVSAIKGRGDPSTVQALRDRFAKCPGWNGGHHYDRKKESGVLDELQKMRVETLTNYGILEQLAATVDDPDERERRLNAMARQWAEEFDANSLITLRDAAIGYDVTQRLSAIKAPVLYVLSRTDALFPPELGPRTVAMLKDVGVDAQYFEIDSDFGHRAPSADPGKWAGALDEFLKTHCS